MPLLTLYGNDNEDDGDGGDGVSCTCIVELKLILWPKCGEYIMQMIYLMIEHIT